MARSIRNGEAKNGKPSSSDQPARPATAPLGARLDQPEVLRIAGAEIAAGARPPRHGRAPRACRTGPRAAPPAWRSAPGTAPPPTAAGRRSGSAAPRPRRRSASPARAPTRLSSPPTRAAGKALRPMMAMVWPSPESSAISMPASAPVSVESAPGQRIDGVQVDAALRRQQRVLAGGAHAHAPAPEAQERQQGAVDERRRQHQQRRTERDARAARQRDGEVGDAAAAGPDTAAAPTRPAP